MKRSLLRYSEVIAELIALLLLTFLGLLIFASEARGQGGGRGAPHLAFVYPAGGQQGSTFTVSVGGQNLNGAMAAYFSSAGVTARVTDYERPLTQKEINDYRERVQQLQDKRAKEPLTADETAEAEKLRQQLATRANRQVSPALAETVTLEVTIAPDAPPGEREVRVRAVGGLSNPFVFCVGTLPEVSAAPALATNAPPPRLGRLAPPDAPPMASTIPAIANGQILPGETDRFRFTAHAGQRLALAVQARALIPYLADAVPGWFQATLAVRDAAGRELGYDDDDGANPDPALSVTIPADGEYTIEIRDAIYRGREDFVYRLTLRADSEQPVAAAPPAPRDLHVPWPARIDGVIARAGAVDVVRFDGRAGATLVAEIVARRNGSPLDATLELLAPNGTRLAFNDDTDDKAAGLVPHQADPRLMSTLPADGVYTLRITDAQHRGGPDFCYRLRLGPPEPDFELRVVPASVNVRAGMSVPVTAHVIRRDGFDGEVLLTLRNPPRGFALQGARIPAGADQVQFTLSAPGLAPEEPVALELNGRATIAGQTVVHSAVAAEEMMQAFANKHLVPAQTWFVAVAGRGAPFRVLSPLPLQLPAGGTLHVRVAVPSARFARDLKFELERAPDGIRIELASLAGETAELVLSAEAEKLKPGTRGNLIIQATGERATPPAGGRAARVPLGALPAIPFEIVRPPERQA